MGVRFRSVKVLHFVEGKSEVLHNFDVSIYQMTSNRVAKGPISTGVLHGSTRFETRPTFGVRQIDPLGWSGSREQVHPGPCVGTIAALQRLDGHASWRERHYCLDASRPFR